MKTRTRKALLAGGVALTTALTDVSLQLANGSASITRSAIVGIVAGIVARVLGALLAAISMPEDPPSP